MSDNDGSVVTEATWRPGLPPPIEALQKAFPPSQGYTIEYGESLQRDPESEDGWRRTPIAIVSSSTGEKHTFFPSGFPGHSWGAS